MDSMKEDRNKNGKARYRIKKGCGCLSIISIVILFILCILQLPLMFERIRISKLNRAVDQLNAQRVIMDPPCGLLDVRGAIHVHSELSHDSMGTLDQILEGAHALGKRFVIMAEHPEDSALEMCRNTITGIHDGILFIPGVEMNTPLGGILAFGWDHLELSSTDPVEETARRVKSGNGLIFICHSETWDDWDMPFHGAELFNLHADFMEQDLLKLFPKIIYSIKRYPYLCFQEAYVFPKERLASWDKVLTKKVFVGIAGNDSHRNVGIRWLRQEDGRIQVVKADGGLIAEDVSRPVRIFLNLVNRNPKDKVVFELILDQYANSFSYVSTRVWTPDLTKESIMNALRTGKCYICYEALANPEGFLFQAIAQDQIALMGDTLPFTEGIELEIRFPIPCAIRLLKDGELCAEIFGRSLLHRVQGEGVYRVEGWLSLQKQEERLWLLSNPIYIRQ